MKTQSIKSIATLLGLAVSLNLSALAGPGPQSQQTWYAGQGQSVATPAAPASAAHKTPTIAFGGTKLQASESHQKVSVFTTTNRVSAPTVTAVNGPHGIFFVYR